MPAGAPYTDLCRKLARREQAGRADLHTHTVYSDGAYTPRQLVEVAERCGLAAIAVTDHDTIAGNGPAQCAANGSVEVVPGVELSTTYGGRSMHVLGLFVRCDDAALLAQLERLRCHRAERYREMVDRLAKRGMDRLEPPDQRETLATLGRRHLAAALVGAGWAGSVREAFGRWLRDDGSIVVPHVCLSATEAIHLVRAAGGVAAWAHPSDDCTRHALEELRDCGLSAVEVEYPSVRARRTRELRSWASELHLAVVAGSDCHGPSSPRHALGSCSVTAAELDTLRAMVR